jgi:membrane-bound serine protease (ClpP class)
MITMAADIAAMAPGTNIGAAHPVGLGGKEIGKVMSDKIINDMVAHVKSIAKKRGRNALWAEKAVRESVSIDETEALKKKVIDMVAKDLDDLIERINGREVRGKGKLHLDNPRKTILKETLRTKILKPSRSNYCLYFDDDRMAGIYSNSPIPARFFRCHRGDFDHPGFFFFQTLPVNYAGILLIFLASFFSSWR